MRQILLLFALLLPGCEGPALVATAGVNVASVTLVGRSVPDIVVSAVSGRDCSIVRLDRGLSYCGPTPNPPNPPPYCTRSLGQVDCWVTRPATIPMVPSVVDGPVALTPAQEARRAAHWPWF